MHDLISRQQAIDAVKKNTFRLIFAEEQNCEGHVAWSANAVYSDVMEGALLDLPSIQLDTTNDDYISRQAALNLFPDDNLYWDTNEGYFAPHYARTLLRNLPSVQPKRKKGHWVFVHPLQKNDNGAYICSECKVGNWEIDPKSYFFCPNCGADLRGERDE